MNRRSFFGRAFSRIAGIGIWEFGRRAKPQPPIRRVPIEADEPPPCPRCGFVRLRRSVRRGGSAASERRCENVVEQHESLCWACGEIGIPQKAGAFDWRCQSCGSLRPRPTDEQGGIRVPREFQEALARQKSPQERYWQT